MQVNSPKKLNAFRLLYKPNCAKVVNENNSTESDIDSINSVELIGDYVRINLEEVFFDFPIVWLRDNCQCSKCFHTNTFSRIIEWTKFDIEVQLNSISVSANKKNIVIIWNDKHVSEYGIDWLYDHNFSNENREHFLKNIYRPKRIIWNKDNFKSILKKYDFEDVLNNDIHFKDWLYTLSVYGVALITNVPPSEGSCRKLANKVGFIKKTHYGEEWIVKTKPDATNFAYVGGHLQMHTDAPYYEQCPGINILHFVTQVKGEGGENILSDGFYTSEYLRKTDSECYKMLTNTLVDWEDLGQEDNSKFHSLLRSPVICEDLEGEIVRINYSVTQRSSHFNVPIEDVTPWYKCLHTFTENLVKNATLFKVLDGEMLCFDNSRLVHGRQDYTDTKDLTRYVIGAYVDWDYVYSKLRILNKQIIV